MKNKIDHKGLLALMKSKKCPKCRRLVLIDKNKFCTHGPGKNTLICPGSGKEI